MTEQESIKYFEMRLAEKTHPPTTNQQKAFSEAIINYKIKMYTFYQINMLTFYDVEELSSASA